MVLGESSQVYLKTWTSHMTLRCWYPNMSTAKGKITEVSRKGLNLNLPKCKVKRMNTERVDTVRARGDEAEDVAEFVCLGAKVSKDEGG